MSERKDYAGPFDPDFRYEDLSKEALVRLVREYALIAHLLDRSGLAAVGMRYGQQVVEEIAIEEWRGASPIYGERIRKIMKIEGDGVPAIFKVLQLDPGFPSHYMDVHYELVDEHHGFFELRSCGALLDVEPYGERAVTGMCHTIEDGTFDVTAQAVNPKARIRHVHRGARRVHGHGIRLIETRGAVRPIVAAAHPRQSCQRGRHASRRDLANSMVSRIRHIHIARRVECDGPALATIKISRK